MLAICYLVVQGKPPQYGSNQDTRREPGTIRVCKTKPNTARDEIAIKLQLEIPDALYHKPQLEARVSVPALQGQGPVITADVADNIAEAIKQQTGMTVHLSAVTEEGAADGARS